MTSTALHLNKHILNKHNRPFLKLNIYISIITLYMFQFNVNKLSFKYKSNEVHNLRESADLAFCEIFT